MDIIVNLPIDIICNFKIIILVPIDIIGNFKIIIMVEDEKIIKVDKNRCLI